MAEDEALVALSWPKDAVGVHIVYPEPCACARCEASASQAAGPPMLPALPRKKFRAEYRQCCSGCGVQMLDMPIAKGGPNALWQCEDCAQEYQRKVFVEEHVLQVVGQRWTQEQEVFFEWLRWGKEGSCAIIDAKAGSGKSTTICRAYLNIAREKGSTIFIAFNKSVVEELRLKGMPSRTAHSIGLQAWRRAHPDWRRHGHVQLDEAASSDDEQQGGISSGVCKNKISWVLAELYPPKADGAPDGFRPCKTKHGLGSSMGRFVKKLVSMAKNNGLGVNGCAPAELPESWRDLVQRYGLTSLLEEEGRLPNQRKVDIGIGHAQAVLSKSIAMAEHGVLDYDDLLYMPLLHQIPLAAGDAVATSGYDFVFVDEAQDNNRARISMVERLARPDGKTRIVAVGDPFQAIYGFTGAEHKALELMSTRFEAVCYPLSVTWRCPSFHVDLANRMMALWERMGAATPMQAAPSAEKGVIAGHWWTWVHLPATPSVTFANFPLRSRKDAAVICRFNAPLIMLHYKLLARGVCSHLLGGREVARELHTFLKDVMQNRHWMKRPTLESLLTAVDKHVNNLVAGGRLTLTHVEQKRDLAECMKLLIFRLRSRGIESEGEKVLKSEIDRLFARRRNLPQVTLTTVHKAKGLEWHTVFVLQPFCLPIKGIIENTSHGSFERMQEQNVAYVAITRAKQELLFLKHIKKLRDNPAKIVELFGEAVFEESDEQWWDEHQRQQSGPSATPHPHLSRDVAANFLQVPFGATAGEINAAFKRLALKYHPDKNDASKREHYTNLFQKLQAAKDLLMVSAPSAANG
eukprot:TRINITY_DN53991_c0_g1_i1.p1 TRINITY_DN53991_c0_g1~~TRINITY_DN53991_c0_g1_i1.p1  ORF type:complete len:804 (+),score=111.77 TRINITY_DN53991_c0_g1_i1:73-2484(+)